MKYRFRIVYQTPQLKKIAAMMKRLDLDMGDLAIEEDFELIGQESEIPKLKEVIVKAFESVDWEILKIEGGKIE